MSWDVVIFNTQGKTPPSVEQMEDTDHEPLGRAADVRKQLSTHLPGIDWSDTAWGIYDGGDFSIEFNAGEDDPIMDMMLHVRGGGDAIAAIVKFCRPLGWSALDCSTNEFLDLDKPSQEGWEGFQEFRDKVIKKKRKKGKG